LSRWLGNETAKRTPEMVKHYFTIQGDLIKSFYKKFRHESIETISDVMSKAGVEAGKIAIKEYHGKGMNIISELSHSKGLTIVSLTDSKIHLKNDQCPYSLKGTCREVCEAVMNYDKNIICTISEQKMKLKILKTQAAGDQYCEFIYEPE
jgi:hypothetical protein